MGLEMARAWVSVRGDSSALAADFSRAKGIVRSGMTKMSRMMTGMTAKFLATSTALIGPYAFYRLAQAGEQFNRKMLNSMAIMGDLSDVMRQKLRRSALDVAKVRIVIITKVRIIIFSQESSPDFFLILTCWWV